MEPPTLESGRKTAVGYGGSIACFVMVIFCAVVGAVATSNANANTVPITATVTHVTCGEESYQYTFDGRAYHQTITLQRDCFHNHVGGARHLWIDPSRPGEPSLSNPADGRSLAIVFGSLGTLISALRLLTLWRGRRDRTNPSAAIAWALSVTAAIAAAVVLAVAFML